MRRHQPNPHQERGDTKSKMDCEQASPEVPVMTVSRKRFGKLRPGRILGQLTKFEEEGSSGQGKS